MYLYIKELFEISYSRDFLEFVMKSVKMIFLLTKAVIAHDK